MSMQMMSANWSKMLRKGSSPARSNSTKDAAQKDATPGKEATPSQKECLRYGARRDSTDDEVDSADSGSRNQDTPPPKAHETPTRKTPRSGGSNWQGPGKSELMGVSPNTGRTPRSGRVTMKPPLPFTRNAAATPAAAAQASQADADGDAGSVAESDDASVMTEDDCGSSTQEGESVQVFVRVRPINSTEAAESDQYSCLQIYGDRTLWLQLKHRQEPSQYKFDAVLPETTGQAEIFERAGKPIVDNCMAGYNSSIFAYGQTGAGKTYTMQGPLAAATQENNEQKGLAPRAFEYLFSEIEVAQDQQRHLTFLVRCSMLEIYNEVITDLLNPAATNLQIREDIKRGCYVENLSEQLVQNMSDAMRLMRMGAENRHVGETRLNRESSRSHSVFTCTLERSSTSEDTGVTNVLFSRLNLIDLAGSERIHGGEHGGSQAQGKHFKEACHINKSLTTLGRVIQELVEAQRSGCGISKAPANTTGRALGRTRHVPYRDSRLTFLLQDSLGGNAKTLMIANISPSSVSAQETISTLQFMSRAKRIRNRATINMDARGDVALLQREIVRLNSELDNLRKGYTEPAIQENKQLREKLEEIAVSKSQMEAVLLGLEKDNQNLRAERRRLDTKMAQIQRGANTLDALILALNTKLMHHESLAAETAERSTQLAEAAQQLQAAELQAQRDASDAAFSGLQQQVAEVTQELQVAQQEAAGLRDNLQQLEAEKKEKERELSDALAQTTALLEAAQSDLSSTSSRVETLETEAAQLKQELSEAQESISQASASQSDLQQQLGDAVEARDEAQEALAVAKSVNEGLDSQVQELLQRLSKAESALADRDQQLADSNQELAAVQQQFAASAADLAAAQQQMAEQQQEAAAQAAAGSDERQQLLQQLEETQQDLASSRMQHQEAEARASSLSGQVEQQQQRLAELESLKASAASSNDDLQQQLSQLRQQSAEAAAAAAAAAAELQQQLEAEQGRTAEGAARVAALESDIAALGAAGKEQASALEAEKEHSKQLQQQLEASGASLAAATTRADQLSADLAAARDSSKSRQEELMKQVKEMHQQLNAGQQEQERLRDELDASRSDNTMLQGQLSDLQAQIDRLQGQVSSKGLDIEALRKKLAAAEAGAAGLQHDLAERDDELEGLRQQLAAAEAAAQDEQQKGAEELNSLQRELMDNQELLTSREFEAEQMQCRLDELMQRLADRNSCIDAHKEEVKGLKSQMARMEGLGRQREALLADKSALADQLQADNEALHSRLRQLQEDLSCKEAQLRYKLNSHELQLKEQIVYNARNRQAMNEIRKVINWAQQPPVLTSSAATAGASGSPSHAAMERGGSSSSRHPGRHLVPFAGSSAGTSRADSPEDMGALEAAGPGPDAFDGIALTATAGPGARHARRGSSGSSSSLAPGLPGPQAGTDCVPLVLDESDGSAGGCDVPLSLAADAAMLSTPPPGKKACRTGGSGGGRGSSGAGDGLVAVTIGSGGSGSRAKGPRVLMAAGQGEEVAGQGQQGEGEECVIDGEVSWRGAGQQFAYTDDTRSELSSDNHCRPEPASSPLGHSSEEWATSSSTGKGGGSRRSGDRASRQSAGRPGTEQQQSYAGKRRHNATLLVSADRSEALSMSGEWGPGGHEMKLPATIVDGSGSFGEGSGGQ